MVVAANLGAGELWGQRTRRGRRRPAAGGSGSEALLKQAGGGCVARCGSEGEPNQQVNNRQ